MPDKVTKPRMKKQVKNKIIHSLRKYDIPFTEVISEAGVSNSTFYYWKSGVRSVGRDKQKAIEGAAVSLIAREQKYCEKILSTINI